MLSYDQLKPKSMVAVLHPGRSGSKSFISFMNKQPECYFTWEQSQCSPQPGLSSPAFAMHTMQNARQSIVGDTDPAWLWHIGNIIPLFHWKILYLHRDADEVADSFWTYCEDITKKPGFNPLLSYPFLGVNGDRDDIYRTVRWYQETVKQLMSYFPDRIYMIPTKLLNDELTQRDILDYLHVPEDGRIYNMPQIRSWGARREASPTNLEDMYRKQLNIGKRHINDKG